jgi:hypothetical protein
VDLAGTADAGAGGTLPATVRVQVTEPGEANAALTPGTTTGASFTEPGYSAAGVVNGNLTDKAWSNWRSGTKNPTDTLTVTLPEPRDLTRVVTRFWKDGSHASWAQRLSLEARVDGAWVPLHQHVPTDADPAGPAPVVDLAAGVRADAVRVTMVARPETHMVVSEIEVFAKVPGVGTDATARSVTVGGEPLAGFDPAVGAYELHVDASAGVPDVAATATDPYASVAVADADAVPGTTTVTVTAEDGTTAEYAVAWVPETVTVSARSECVGSRVRLEVKVANAGASPVAVDLDTGFGTRRLDVAAGESVERVVATRAGAVPAGEVRAVVDGGRTVTAPYPAADCA